MKKQSLLSIRLFYFIRCCIWIDFEYLIMAFSTVIYVASCVRIWKSRLETTLWIPHSNEPLPCLSDPSQAPMSSPRQKTLLVTVGTTKFDDLISSIFHHDIKSLLLNAGLSNWIVQHGKSPCPTKLEGVSLTLFDYAPDLSTFIHQAGLVISHAGTRFRL